MGRGINREAKTARYRRAVGRQQLLCDRGSYREVVELDATFIFANQTPAPAVQFMNTEDRWLDGVDYRSDAIWASKAKREARADG